MTVVPAPCLQPIVLSTIVPHDDTQPSSVIEAVDQPRYAAKKKGWNRIEALRAHA